MSNDVSPIPANVLKEVKQVRDQVWDVFGQWHLFVGLIDGQETVKLLAWAFNRGAGGLIQQAIRSELAVAIGRLLDPAQKKRKKEVLHNLTLDRMIAHVESYANKQATGMKDELAEMRRRYEPFKRWRDKYHAHRDHAVAMGLDPIPLPQIDREIVDHLLAAMRHLMGRICLALDGSQTYYDEAYEGAADQLLAFIRPKYQASQERLRRAEEGL